jgi:hypothetical protein
MAGDIPTLRSGAKIARFFKWNNRQLPMTSKTMNKLHQVVCLISWSPLYMTTGAVTMRGSKAKTFGFQATFQRGLRHQNERAVGLSGPHPRMRQPPRGSQEMLVRLTFGRDGEDEG